MLHHLLNRKVYRTFWYHQLTPDIIYEGGKHIVEKTLDRKSEGFQLFTVMKDDFYYVVVFHVIKYF